MKQKIFLEGKGYCSLNETVYTIASYPAVVFTHEHKTKVEQAVR